MLRLHSCYTVGMTNKATGIPAFDDYSAAISDCADCDRTAMTARDARLHYVITGHYVIPRDDAPADSEGLHTVNVSIGRNVGDAPMMEGEWQAFRASVSNALAVAGNATDPTDYALDEWQGTSVWQGIAEDNAHYQLRTARPLSGDARDALAKALTRYAAMHQQDAIAIAYGYSRLITPAPVAA